VDPEEIRARVGGRIRELAARRKVTLNDLADRAKVSRSHLYAMLGGERAATTDVLTKLATALDVDPHELLKPPRAQTKARKGTPSG
jgi:transcriptional regulator with XRE-family HTH domain